MEKKRAKWGLIFCLPFILTFLVFQLYPIIYSFYLSLTFQENSRNFVFVGFDNYKDLINDKTFWKSVGNTWKIWLMNFIPQLIFGLVLAILLTQYKIKGAGFFRAVFYLPNLITCLLYTSGFRGSADRGRPVSGDRAGGRRFRRRDL